MMKNLSKFLPWSLLGASLVTAVCSVLFVVLSTGVPAPTPAKGVPMSTVQTNPAYAWTTVSQGFGLAADKVKLDALPTAAALATQISNAVADKETVFGTWGSNGNPATTSPRWMPRAASAAVVNTSQGTLYYPVPRAGTITRIAAGYNVAAQATDNITYTVDVNSVSSGLSCTLTPSVITCQGTGSVAVVTGDMVSIRVVQSGSTASTANSIVGISVGWKSP